MKNLYITLFLALMVAGLSAQTNKGKILLGLTTGVTGNLSSDLILGKSSSGGNLLFGTIQESGEDEVKYSQFNISPAFGIFLDEGFLAGVELNLHSETIEDGGSDFTTTVFGGGPFLRYYISSGKVRPILEARANFGSVSFKYDGEKDENSPKLTRIGVGAGAAIFLNDHVSFDLLAGYYATTVKLTDDEKNKVNLFGLTLGFSFFL